jgi:hypothetical protein
LSTIIHVSYLSSTGTGTSAGHEFDVPVKLPITPINGGYEFIGPHSNGDGSVWFDPTCIVDMPGLPQPGAYTDVTLIIDPNNKNDESNTGNNTHKLRIMRQ